MSYRFATTRGFALAALIFSVALTGCDRERLAGPLPEIEDSNFKEGKRLAEEGKHREALIAFKKVIDSRREAPETHLEIGNLCIGPHIKDPLQAIFHFRRFIDLRPDAVQVQNSLIQQRIRTAEKDFLKTLPFRPLEGNNADRVTELQEQIKAVRAENESLKLRLLEARTTVVPSAPPEPDAVAEAPAVAGSAPRVNLAATLAATPPPVAKATPGRRSHTVVSGDTLVVISRKYYGTTSRWRDILNANSRTMRNERDLKPGKVLVIPE